MDHELSYFAYYGGSFAYCPVVGSVPVPDTKPKPLPDGGGTRGTGGNVHCRPLTRTEVYLAGPTGDRAYETFAGLSDAGQRVYLKETQRQWNEYLYWKIVLLPKLEHWVKTGEWVKEQP